MRFRMVFGALALMVCMMLGGCGESLTKTSYEPGGMEVSVNGGDGQFPKFLAGKWISDKQGWEFNFEPDGKLSSAVISMGRTRVEPGKIRHVSMKYDKKGEMVPGDWSVAYDYETRELVVNIEIRHFFMEMGDDAIEGKSEEIFMGEVSDDVMWWNVTLQSYPNYVAHFSDKPDFKMATKNEFGEQYSLTFTKVVDKQK